MGWSEGKINFLPGFVLLLFLQLAISLDSPVVEIDQGKLEGKVLYSRGGREFYGFFGIPYGQAKRFEAATPAAKWEGILAAKESGPDCAQSQYFINEISGEENCLHLQVHSRNLKENLPVIFFIHGGGFTVGSGNQFGPEYFMDEDVVLVIIQYRVGAFGFLSTGDETIPGNFGLKDQSLALKWVQDNIAQFGGNPFSVTIMGHSAGSGSVSHHVLSRMSKGLFHAAVPMSGTSLTPCGVIRDARETSRKLGEHIGCQLTTSEEFLECLRGKTMEEILAGQASLTKWGIDPTVPFGPVIEPDVPGAFLVQEPKDLLTKGTFNQVPILTGIVENEGAAPAASHLNDEGRLKEFHEDHERIFPITLNFDEHCENFSPGQQKYIAKRVHEYYFKDGLASNENFQGMVDLYSDRFFHHMDSKFGALVAKHVPVYNYIFAHKGVSITSFFGETNYGVAHCDEMPYIFKHAYELPVDFQKGSEGEKVSKQFVRLWASFATHKSPTKLWGPQLSWPAMTEAEIEGRVPIRFYRIDANTSLVDEPWKARVEFWDKVVAEAEGIAERDEL